jgi:hypothetical protein
MAMRNAPDRILVTGQPAVTDHDGIPEYQWFGLFDIRGIFSVLSVEEVEYWAGQQVEASIRVPLGTNIRPGDRVQVNGQDYAVVTVRPNRLHLRAMVRRVE